LISDPDLKAWPDCWISAEFLCTPYSSEGDKYHQHNQRQSTCFLCKVQIPSQI